MCVVVGKSHTHMNVVILAQNENFKSTKSAVFYRETKTATKQPTKTYILTNQKKLEMYIFVIEVLSTKWDKCVELMSELFLLPFRRKASKLKLFERLIAHMGR